MSFHEIRFPTAISRGAVGGPERRTDVVVLGSGFEERNSRWADSRRSYNAGYGIRSLDDLACGDRLLRGAARAPATASAGATTPTASRARRWLRLPPSISRSAPVTALPPSSSSPRSTARPTRRGPVPSASRSPARCSSRSPAPSRVKAPTSSVDAATGVVTFTPGHIPADGAAVTAGFEFDVPVRFDTDKLEISLSGFRHGAIPNIPIVEIRL